MKDSYLMHHSLISPPVNRALIAGLACFVICVVWASQLMAQSRGGPVLIRDTEIEGILRDWSEPVIKAANLNPDSVNILIVQDPNINAFVAGGQNVFLYSGLLIKTENASEALGVIAHELGHISGGHLVRTRGAMQSASYEAILGTILGLGAAVLTGEGQIGAAIATGSQSMAMGRFLAFSRVQESSADQAGFGFLTRAGLTTKGMVSFMQKLQDEELLPPSQQSEYVRTHPLTRDRVEALEAARARHGSDGKTPAAWADQHARMNAKFIGFIHPERVSWTYDDRDRSIPADYARAIAAYRQNNIDQALSRMDGLIAREPDNPFFYELKGQMLVDFGRIEQALPYYEQALSRKNDAPLMRIAYAHALIESGGTDHDRLRTAIRNLQQALRDEPRTPRIHRLLATAHGRMNENGAARLHLAEEAVLQRRLPQARAHANAALEALPEGTALRIRAQDLLNHLENVDPQD